MTNTQSLADQQHALIGPKVGMAIMGFVSGLPYVVFTGTINAWFVEYGMTTKTIGVFALITLPYAFKFLWSPAITASAAPIIGRFAQIGQLRSWILACLAVIAPTILLLPFISPSDTFTIPFLGSIPMVGIIAGLSLLTVFASATQDIAVAGWRIGIAKDEKELNTLTAIEQFTYRLSAFFGGALALVLAQNFGWDLVWNLISGLFVLCFIAIFFVPDAMTRQETKNQVATITLGGGLLPSQRRLYLMPLIAVWVVSLVVVFGFMIYVLAIDPSQSVKPFTKWAAPIIASACVLSPIISAALIKRQTGASLTQQAPIVTFGDKLYVTLLEPFIDLVIRLRWGLVSFLFLTLFYRYADAVWGSLAYPFYLGAPEVNGGLGHSFAEVAAASKTFGVLMTMAGVALGGFLMSVIGRMPTLVLGGFLAAVTNFLYADIAGAHVFTDQVINFIHLDVVFPAMNGLVNLLSPAEDVVVGNALGRLMLVIASENLAVGLASVVYVAYLSSVVNKRYAAVQFALLASLSMLVATMTKPILGELADERGFVYVFILTAILGMLGVAAAIAEWVRIAKHEKSRG